MSRFVVYAKRTDELQAQLRMFCVTDDKEDKALERIERFIQVAKSRDVEVSDKNSRQKTKLILISKRIQYFSQPLFKRHKSKQNV